MNSHVAPLTLDQILGRLRARWRSGLLAFLLTMLVITALLLVLPKRYSPTAQVLVDIKSFDPIAGLVVPSLQASTYMATQADVLSSGRVLEAAARNMNLADSPQVREDWEASRTEGASIDAWLADWLGSSLKVEPAKDSNVLAVSWSSPDPVFATRVVNAIVDAYIQTSLKLRVEPARQFNTLFADEAARLRTALDEARARLAAYERENGIVVTDNDLDLETRQLAELTSQLVQVRVEADRASSQNRIARGDRTGQSTDQSENRIIENLSTELSRAIAELNRTRQTLGSQHPDVLSQQQLVGSLRGRLAEASRRISQNVDVRDRVGQSRLQQLGAEVDRQRERVLSMKDRRDKAVGLTHDVEVAQRAFDTVHERASQASLESQASHTNVSVLHRAQVPLKASFPPLKKGLIAGFGLALMLAVLVPLYREHREPRLRSIKDVGAQLGLPLAGVLLERDRKSRRGREVRNRIAGPARRRLVGG